MTDVAYIVAGLAVALGAWDGFRRWVEAQQARAFARGNVEDIQRNHVILDTRLKQIEQQFSAIDHGVQECQVRLDTIKMQGPPTREQWIKFQDEIREEQRGFDKELRTQFKLIELNDAAIKVTGAQVRDLTEQQTAILSVRGSRTGRVGA
jgi:hypothetical protein